MYLLRGRKYNDVTAIIIFCLSFILETRICNIYISFKMAEIQFKKMKFLFTRKCLGQTYFLSGSVVTTHVTTKQNQDSCSGKRVLPIALTSPLLSTFPWQLGHLDSSVPVVTNFHFMKTEISSMWNSFWPPFCSLQATLHFKATPLLHTKD